MKNPKGLELALNSVVLIVVVLIVLIVALGFFFGGMGKSGGSIADIGSDVSGSADSGDISKDIGNIKTVFGCWYCTDGSGNKYVQLQSGKTFRGYADSDTCLTNNNEKYPDASNNLKNCDSSLGSGYSCKCI